MGKRILHVSDLPVDTRARELAREFERYGPIVRCDVPIPRRDARHAFAFVEFEDSRDALDAYERLHGKRFRSGSIRIEWAKRGADPRNRGRRSDGGNGRGRSRSPRGDDRKSGREDNDRTPRGRSRSADRSRSVDRSPRARSRSASRTPRNRSRSVCRSPRDSRDRSASPVRSPKMTDHEESI